MPFAIGNDEAEQWMLCMRKALAETIDDDTVRAFLDQSFARVALHMRNR